MKRDVKLFYGSWNDDTWEFVKQFTNEKAMFAYMNKMIKDMGFKSYYTRGWVEGDGSNIIDFGSHSKFFKYKYVQEF
jgi:hypothetical protein